MIENILTRNSREAQARKLATVIYPNALKPHARGFYNNDNLWERKLQKSILNEQPIQIIGFWGIGSKQKQDKYDDILLAEYGAIRATIDKHYAQGAEMTLILANTHGKFNGYQEFEEYLGQVANGANQRGIASVALDDLYQQWNIKLPNTTTVPDRESPEWLEFTENLKREDEIQRNHQRGSRRFTQLVESASKHSRTGIDPVDAAFYYWLMRQRESIPLSQSFPNGILFIKGSDDLGRIALPLDMPHLYSRIGPVWFQHD